MTIEEVFSTLAKHMIEGLMIHSKLADFYGFIGLDGYKKCHEYHFFCESKSYRELNNYYLHHFGKLIIDKRFNTPDVIPENWLGYTRADVGDDTRTNSIQAGIEKWVLWERQTKKLYQSAYIELVGLEEIAAAMFVKTLLVDVDYELAEAEQEWIEKRAMDYDVNDIMPEQEQMKKKYCKKMKEIQICSI